MTANSNQGLGTRVIRGTIGGLSITLLSNLFFFIAQLIIPRSLSRPEYAQFTVSLSFVVLMSLVADLGLLHMHTRQFAECFEDIAQGRADRRGSLFGSVLTLRLALSFFVSMLVVIVAPLIYGHDMVANMEIFLISLFVSSRILIVRAAGESLLRGRGLYYVASFFVLIDSATFVLILVALAQTGTSLRNVVWAYSISGLPGFILMSLYIFRWLRAERIRLSIDYRIILNMLRMALPLSFATAFFVIFNEGDKLLLDKLSTAAEVSNFGAVIRISTGLAVFPIVLGAILSPELTRLLKRKDYVRARNLTGLATRVLLIAGGGIGLTVSLLSKTTTTILLGQKYVTAAPALEWVGLLMIPFFVASFIAELMIAAGLFRTNMLYMAIVMCMAIGGDLVLIPRLGASGAAISRLMGVTIGIIFLLIAQWKANFIDMPRLSRSFLNLGIAILLSLFLGVTLRGHMADYYVAASIIIFYLAAIHFLKLMQWKDVLYLVNSVFPKNKNTPESI